ncbi:MAG: sigma 54-interacting transcriptional regulator, partial [Candidatus Edwardsbacteria bacterium]|nr:sigma 54-interacting transcriptional regulator [Candidatus Edwardsbacteria bacterium]
LRTGLLLGRDQDFVTAFTTEFVFRGYLYAICFYLVAAFSGYLAERLRLKGRQLEDTTRALEEFKLSTGDILEKMGSGLLTINEKGQIVYCNLAGLQILGLGKNDIIGRNVSQIAVEGLESLGSVLNPENALTENRSQRMEIKISRGREEGIPVGVSTTSVYGSQGKLEGIIAIFQDLSTVKSLENRLIEMEQLETSKELTKSLLKLLHPYLSEINATISELMRENEVDPVVIAKISQVRQKTEYIRKTIDDFARFAHIEIPGASKTEQTGREYDSRIIGRSPNFVEVMNMVQQVAPTDSTVLVSGESGTGKELLARELHRLSGRGKGPFVSINCAALPEALLESELFGHVKGSFTGAMRDKDGLFRVASGGTFFLDEVSETSPAIQVKLLRVLQEREIVPVGGTRPIKVDVRVISATNCDLAKAVENNKFRMDLFYRLNVIQITIPPLRDRKDDVLLLADEIIDNYCRKQNLPVKLLSAATRDALMQYNWPGNVRELENVLERAIILEPGPVIEKNSLPDEVLNPWPESKKAPLPEATDIGNLKDKEKQTILRVLAECNNNKSLAAKKLGIHYATLYRKLKSYNITDE